MQIINISHMKYYISWWSEMHVGNQEESIKISDKRAREFARSFYTAIAEYCAAHNEEFDNWIKANENRGIEK
jgi:hypothetical protein